IINAKKNDSLMQKKIQNKQYVFVPQTYSSPTLTIPINTIDFQLRVTADSVIASLPYFGRSHTAQIGRSDDDGIKFTSTNFYYSAVAKKKGKWEISIEPKDAKGVRLFLTVFNNGDAQMDVTSPSRETMLFKGYIW